jgi:hypothetical protein
MKGGQLASDTPYPVVVDIVSKAVSTGNVVLHFHGGLVDENSGREIAKRLTQTYQDAAAYPIFAVWEAGLIDTIRNNLGEIAEEKPFRKLLEIVTRIARRKFIQDDGGRAAGALPALDATAEEAKFNDALDAGDENFTPVEPEPIDGLQELTDFEFQALEMELQLDPELYEMALAITNGLRETGEFEREQGARAGVPVIASTATMMDAKVLDNLIEGGGGCGGGCGRDATHVWGRLAPGDHQPRRQHQYRSQPKSHWIGPGWPFHAPCTHGQPYRTWESRPTVPSHWIVL